MNKELKISDKSPFEKIRKFDGQGRSYWTSREFKGGETMRVKVRLV